MQSGTLKQCFKKPRAFFQTWKMAKAREQLMRKSTQKIFYIYAWLRKINTATLAWERKSWKWRKFVDMAISPSKRERVEFCKSPQTREEKIFLKTHSHYFIIILHSLPNKKDIENGKNCNFGKSLKCVGAFYNDKVANTVRDRVFIFKFWSQNTRAVHFLVTNGQKRLK